VKRYQESLSPDKKALVLNNDSAAHQKQRQSLSRRTKVKYYAMMLMHIGNNTSPFLLRKKVKNLETDADAHKKKWESLSPKDKD
jgi:hypothetical protein